MYWTRADSVWGFAPWLLMSAIYWAGGCFICASFFRLAAREQLACGLGVGLVLFITFSNLAAHLAPLSTALWSGAVGVLAIGLVGVWRAGRPVLRGFTLSRVFTQFGVPLILLILLTLFFGEINRGLAIFDDYHNLPLVSTMAAGDVPPHFYLNTPNWMAYHYGWHLFAASLVRMGDLFPWSAFDISKALSLSLLALLAWLWFRRWTRSQTGAFLGALLVLFGGGSRWLLLLLSPERLAEFSSGLILQGSSAYSGPDLASNLSGPWLIEGDGPMHFPFAFANGIFPPGVMALGGSGAIPLATLFLLLLLSPRGLSRNQWNLGPGAIYAFILASMGLTAEYLLAPLLAGLGLVVLLGIFSRLGVREVVRRPLASSDPQDVRRSAGGWLALRERVGFFNGRPTAVGGRSLALWSLILTAGALLALAQGGLLTEMLRRWLAQLGGEPAVDGSGFIGFSLRWPPGLVSAHLGELSFSKPGQMLVGLAEIGPVLLLAPWVTCWAWRQWKRGRLLKAGLGAAALIGFLAPIFVQYTGRDRDITHMTGSALFIWMVVAFPLVWIVLRRGRPWLRPVLAAGTAITLFGGMVLLAFQMLAIPRPQLTTFVGEEDAALASLYWNRLEPGAQILDPIPYRAITLFGLGGGRAYRDFFLPLPEWKALFEDPDPVRMARAGYSYLYHDQEWWGGLTRVQKDRFKTGCVWQINQGAEKGVGMRRLLDIHTCR